MPTDFPFCSPASALSGPPAGPFSGSARSTTQGCRSPVSRPLQEPPQTVHVGGACSQPCSSSGTSQSGCLGPAGDPAASWVELKVGTRATAQFPQLHLRGGSHKPLYLAKEFSFLALHHQKHSLNFTSLMPLLLAGMVCHGPGVSLNSCWIYQECKARNGIYSMPEMGYIPYYKSHRTTPKTSLGPCYVLCSTYHIWDNSVFCDLL